MNKETLEEVAETELRKQNWDTTITLPFNGGFIEGFQQGAKWMQERMYSEEDLREAFFSAIKSTGEGWNGEYASAKNPDIKKVFTKDFEEWFEQFKKGGYDE